MTRRREHLGISQQYLAELIDTSQKQVSKYEAELTIPGANKLALIAIHLQTSADYLLCLTDNSDPTN